ncbi:MAG TPA: AmmeMemoRadiSam system protein B [Roseiarcus sp.]|jgi:hypothetical protein
MSRARPPDEVASVHPAQVAGHFYPSDPGALAGALATAPPSSYRAKMVVVPHAGVAYSGAVAAQAVRALDHSGGLRRAVILGPNHRMPLRGVALHPASAWASPLGVAPVAGEALRAVAPLEGVSVNPQPFEGEHSLEMVLIFLQRLGPGLEIVPALVGDAPADLVEEVLARLWGGPETAICISSDLSHFHPRHVARMRDAETRALVETGHWREIGPDNACGYASLRGAIRRAEALRMRATGVAFATSDDAGGPRDRVVGYGAFAFEYPEIARLTDAERVRLLAVASASLDFAAESRGAVPNVADARLPAALTAHRAAFVTLERGGDLRGCVGSVRPHRPLVRDVAINAASAGFDDPRFPPLARSELPELTISISVLSPSAPMRIASERDLVEQLRPGEDGLSLRDHPAAGLYLPSVWRDIPSPADFVRSLKRKMGLAADHWSPTMTAERFTVESFGGRFLPPDEAGVDGVSFGG